MHLIQLVHTLNYGDAISGEALAIQRMMSRQGQTAWIHVVNAHEKVAEFSRSFHDLEEDIKKVLAVSGQVTVLMHYSIASPLNDIFRRLEGVRKVLLYHNLTPEKWYWGYNARVVEHLIKGRQELPELVRLADLVLADSIYNQQDLFQMCNAGSDSASPNSIEAKVLPLPLDEEKWAIETNRGIAEVLRNGASRNFLHVGRFAPNKCIEDIVKAFYFYHHKIDKDSRLWLIGSDVDTEIYGFELRRLIFELRLKEAVMMPGSLADCELKAFYENCDAYICMSEHEGFCVPLLEAMFFGLPVIAYNATAVGDTLGGAGLLLDVKDPACTAELMELVVSDQELRSELVSLGKARAQVFAPTNFQALLREYFLG